MTKKLALLCLILGAVVSQGLDPTKPFSTYVHHSWSSNGLPQHTIYDILQTRDGYIWLATAEGPVRFDSLQFQPLDPTSIPNLHAKASVALLEGSDGAIWIAFYGPGGGLVRYANGSFRLYGSAQGLANSFFTGMAEDRLGKLWIGTEDGLFVSGNGKFVQYPLGKQISRKISSVVAGHDGRIWVATEREILAIHSEDHNSLEIVTQLREPRTLFGDDEGTLWIGTNHDGLYRLSGRRLIQQAGKEFYETPISTIYQDRHKTMWIGSLGKGLCRLGSSIQCFTKSDGLSSNQVNSVYEDREGSLWIGTLWAGLNRLHDGDFRAHGINNSPTQNVWSVELGRDGSVWAGTDVGLEHLLRDGLTTELKLGDAVTAIEETRSGVIWVGTGYGLKEIKKGKVVRVYTTADGLASDKINALHEDSLGNLWIGTFAGEGGLTLLSKGAFKKFTPNNGLASMRIHTIVEDATHVLWFGTSAGVTRFDGTFTNYPLHHESERGKSDVVCIYPDHGDLWLGTDGAGLVRMRDGVMTFIRKADGLYDDTIWSVVGDERALWMTSNRGLFQVQKKDLDDLAEHKVKWAPFVSYGTEDGLVTSEFNGGSQSSGVRTPDGRMWFASIEGVVEVDQQRFARNNIKPPVVMEDVLLDHRALKNGSRLNVGAGNLEFHFSSLSFVAPEKNQYRYKLEGFDRDWIPVANRTAYYTNVPPGTYKFRVIVSNNDGLWNTDGTSFDVTLTPHLFQSWPFRIVSGCIVLAVPFAIVGIRHRAQRRMEHRLKVLIEQHTAELTRAKNEAEAIARAKSELLDNVSHEIRTPINGLLGMVELLRGGDLSPQQMELADAACYSGNTLLNVLNQILAFSALEAKTLTLAAEEFDFSNCGSSVRHMLTGAAAKRNTQLAFRLSPDIPGRLVGDPNRVVEVLLNLVGNAIKFTPDGGNVTVSTNVIRKSQSDLEIEVCVADTGIGIDRDQQKHIFEPFRQADGSLSRKFGGTGLGLSIASKLINLMGGRIWLESELGKGSKFFFTVMFQIPATSSMPGPTEAGRALRILVVEDNIVNQRFAVRVLKKQSWEVTTAENGREALKRMTETSFDLILMDIQMPVMNGVEATIEIRRLEENSSRHIPIVALTAHASADDQERCMKAGMDAYLSKPVSGSVLVSTIREVHRRFSSLEVIASH